MPKKSLTPYLLQGSQTFFCELNTFIPHNSVSLDERVQARTLNQEIHKGSLNICE